MDFLAFLQDYYYLIILVLALLIIVLELVLSFRVKPNQNILSFIDKILPSLIIEAENRYGSQHGEDKYLYVFRGVSAALSNVFNIKNSDTYEKYIKEHIELILSTPKKKEGE